MTLLLFLALITMALFGIGFIAGVLLAGPSSYERGWNDHRREYDADLAERRSAGFRVVG